MAKKKTQESKNIEQYEHLNQERLNNPPVGLVTAHGDKDVKQKKVYEYDPHIDPQLQWAGKKEHSSLEIQTVSLHVHERIDPKKIIETVKKQETEAKQSSLFETFQKPLRQAVEFYKHQEGWSNRLVAGDSLLVMNSLIEKEAMAGKVQMVYFDPPYGIKYGSNFQPFTNKRDVKDGKDEDLSTEPEMIKAFRDTWELGIHSYLTYLRDRLYLAKQLLSESGSIFVQISDENMHLVRNIMDEVFERENFVCGFYFRTRSQAASKLIAPVGDIIIWYSKNKELVRFRRLFVEKPLGIDTGYTWVELEDGERRRMTYEERRNPYLLPNKSRIFFGAAMFSSGRTETGSFDVEFENKIFKCTGNHHWKTTKDGIRNLIKNKRIIAPAGLLNYVQYHEDFPYVELNNIWDDTHGESDKKYVVQTGEKVIQRCMLMTTDPSDLVLDITCGSGTTAFVAEQWGRRWITCDTSRVAVTLAKQRLMTAMFDYYELAHNTEGVGSGFKYKTVPHITLKSIANNEPAPQETLYDQPFTDKKRCRVTGPFTVEAVPSPVVIFNEEDQEEQSENLKDRSLSRTGETLRQDEWRNELLRSGVRAKGGKHIEFSRIEALNGTRNLQAEGETKEEKPKRLVVCFGPEHAPLEQRSVELALEEAGNLYPKPEIILFCAFQFDEEAAKDIDETNWAGVTLLKAQMNIDLQIADLKKKARTSESFWLVGQPDVQVVSEEFLVFGNESENNDKRLAHYGTFKKLSGLNSLAEINELAKEDILFYAMLSQNGDLWNYLANAEGLSLDKFEDGIPSVSWHSTRLIVGIGNPDHDLREFGLLPETDIRGFVEKLRGNSQIIGRIKEIARKLGLEYDKNQKLRTKNFTQVEVLGFDYYNPKTSKIESGGKSDIAMWLLDTDYDGRSLFPSQVFFPMSGSGDGWSKLSKNLKAEIDEEKIESFAGTISLPFTAGRAVAVKIIDARGIESLKIIRV